MCRCEHARLFCAAQSQAFRLIQAAGSRGILQPDVLALIKSKKVLYLNRPGITRFAADVSCPLLGGRKNNEAFEGKGVIEAQPLRSCVVALALTPLLPLVWSDECG